MVCFILYATAIATVQHTQGFTPLSTSGRWKTQKQRTQSRSTLFDTEEASPWTVQEWSATEFTGSLNTATSPWDASNNDFMPSEADLKAAEEALSVAKSDARDSFAASRLANLENEFGDKKKRLTANVRETGTDSMKNYIKTMCNHELLNKNEEIILAREIQILLLWEKQREELELQLLRYVRDGKRWLPLGM